MAPTALRTSTKMQFMRCGEVGDEAVQRLGFCEVLVFVRVGHVAMGLGSFCKIFNALFSVLKV